MFLEVRDRGGSEDKSRCSCYLDPTEHGFSWPLLFSIQLQNTETYTFGKLKKMKNLVKALRPDKNQSQVNQETTHSIVQTSELR